MPDFDHQAFFKAIYDLPEEQLITYLEENKSAIPADKKEQLISTIMQNKKWETFDYCVKEDLIHTDLFEYDSLNNGGLNYILTGTKYLSENDLQAFLPHFSAYLNEVDNINEEIESKNLLSFAIQEGLPVAIFQALIDAGIQTNYLTKAEENYLHSICRQRQNSNLDYNKSAIQLFIYSGLDINKTDIEGKTPLRNALENYNLSKPEIIQLLLENGADVNQEDKKGITPIFVAAVYQQNLDLVKSLLEYGTPDFDKKNLEGENLVNAFLRSISNSPNSIEILDAFIQNGTNLTATSAYYQKEKSGIDWIAEKPSEILKHLLDNGSIDVNNADNDGQTILFKVCQVEPNYDEAVAKDLYRKVKYLLKAGAETSIEDRFDKKAVDYAMSDNLKAKIVETLLEK